MTTATDTRPRTFDPEAFRAAYREVILGNHFFEAPDYYRWYEARYRHTIERLAALPLPRPARILEIGGGQIILLMGKLFGDEGVLADVSDEYTDAVTKFGHRATTCDLLHDDLPESDHGTFDLVVLCEVIEHLPVPPYTVLRKIRSWLRPGGVIFLTTPNLYRLRNAVRLLLGMRLFCPFFYPHRGQSIGHPLEYSADHLRWQLDQGGFEESRVEITQLVNVGATPVTKLARWAMSPLLLRRTWRDSLVAHATRPDVEIDQGSASGVNPAAEALLERR